MLGSTLAHRQLLRSSPFFSRLGDSEADAILAQATVARYAEGVLIFAKGDPGNSMMAVLRGRVMISSPSVDGRQVVLTTFREGDVFGEIALLDGKERTADATAAADCELLVVARRSLLGLLERQPELAHQLLIVLCERIRRTNEQVEDFAFLHLETRIAKALLRLAQEEGQRAPASHLGLKISQRALGEIVGSSRESVNKHLQDWKRLGIIELEKGSILIRDVEALAARI
jgi:CRP/FNR family transcriptional regulator, cyclic AMP receptor protein